MTARSENKNFIKGDFVYVLVPLGDFSQKKTILSKVVSDNEIVQDVRPFEKYAPVTENFNTTYQTSLDEYTFIANKDYEKILFTKTFNNPQDYLGYDKLGIKLSIYANLKTLTQEVKKGRYAIRIDLRGIDHTEKTSVNFSDNSLYTYKPPEYINIEDMICINPFYTSGYCIQEKVIDIKDFTLQSIKISIVQSQNIADIFLDQDDIAVSSDNFFIKCKDIYCSLGYECLSTDIETEKLFVYPVDGLRYDFSASVTKLADARLIRFDRDLKHMPYGRIVDSYNFNNWASYSSESSNTDEKFNNMFGYSEILNSGSKQGDYFILDLNTNKGLQENKFILSARRGDSQFVSNELIYKNNSYVKNAELLDNISGFSGRLSDNRENFNIYGKDNKLLNDQDENNTFFLIVSYNSINGRKILPEDIVSWSFPHENTMIVPVNRTKSADIYDYEVEIDENDSLYRDQSYWIPFKIKNIYNQNFINNTIQCNFKFKDENGHEQNIEFTKTLLFGFSGSEGSEYICNMELFEILDSGALEKVQSIYEDETNFSKYTLNISLYDYNMHPVDISNVEYKWVGKDMEFQKTINLAQFKEIPNPMDRIIAIRYPKTNNEYITSYLPVGTLKKKDEVYILEGCKTITYDSFGTKPYYYKGAYKLYKKNMTTPESNVYFTLNFPSIMDNMTSERPTIINKRMRPYEVHIDGLTNFSIQARDTNTDDILLEFPIMVVQNQYSALLEDYNQEISLVKDKVEKIILGNLSNEKSGMILGKLMTDTNDPVKYNIGLYNYIKGKQFFSLDDKNGLIAEGDEDCSQIVLSNGNLNNFILNDCSGTVTNAKKLINENNAGYSIGSNIQPVYFNQGIPVACSTMATATEVATLKNQITQMKQEIEELKKLITTSS